MIEFEKQRLGSIKPLNELLSVADMSDDEWHTLAETRFGISVSFMYKRLLWHSFYSIIGVTRLIHWSS